MKDNIFKLKALVSFNEDSIEDTLHTCENAVCKMTDDPKVILYVTLAIEELLINAVEHGYKGLSGEVSIKISKAQNQINVEVSDKGSGIDSSNINLNHSASSINDAKIRGWGLAIIYKLANEFEILSNSPCGTKIRLSLPL